MSSSLLISLLKDNSYDEAIEVLKTTPKAGTYYHHHYYYDYHYDDNHYYST